MNPEGRSRVAGADDELAVRRESVRRSVLRANRAVTVILLVVFALGVAMVFVSHRAEQSRRRAERAEAEATDRLWHSSVAQARAERLSSEAGHRAAALHAISNAAAIRPSSDLRTEAIASLGMRDLSPEVSWPLRPRAYGFHFDPDLEHYVVSYENDALSLFHLADNSLVRTFRAGEAGLPTNAIIREFMFSGTGRYVAAHYSGGFSVLWERATGRPAHVFGPASSAASSASASSSSEPFSESFSEPFVWPPSFSADDRIMAGLSARRAGRVVRIDLRSGAVRALPGLQPFNETVRLSPRGDVVSWFRGREIFLVDAETGGLRQSLSAVADVLALWWDQKGDQFSTSCRDASVHVWDVRTGISRQLEGRAVNAWMQQFSPDGTKLVTAGVDGVSRIWDLPTGRMLSRTTAGRAFVFGRDGQRIAYGVPGREVGIWRINPPAGYRLLQGAVSANATVSQQDLSPDGRWLAWAPPARANRPGFEVFDLASNGPSLFVPQSSPVSVGFHPARPRLLVAGRDGLRFHDLPDVNLDRGLGPSRPVRLPDGFEPRAFSFREDGRRAVVVSADGRLVIADLEDAGGVVALEGQLSTRLELPGPASLTGSGAVALSPDGKWVVAGRETRDNQPVIWDAQAGRIVHRLPTAAAHVAFSPDGRWLATVGVAECNVWAVGTWEHRWKRARTAMLGGLGAVAFTRDGSLIAFTRAFDEIELADPLTGERIAGVGGGEVLTVAGLRLSGDGRVLVVPGGDGRTHVWDLKVLRTELATWRLDWPSVPGTGVTREATGWLVTAPSGGAALGLGAVGVAGLFGVLVLRRQRRLTDEFVGTAELAAQRTRELVAERELGELKGRFVSLVSHEFRTPLGITMSAVELLRNYRSRLSPEKLQELLNDIYSATLRMSGLMEQVLLLGRVEAGKVPFQSRPLDLSALGAKLIDETGSATNQRCPIELRSSGRLDGAMGDEGLVRHILSNLLSNAVKYSPDGAAVEFLIRRDGVDAVLEVRDRGIGIPEADQARLFDAFHRASNVGDTPGTGLGLLIVRRCVELHRGTISFASKTGEGTAFTVRLPVFSTASAGP